MKRILFIVHEASRTGAPLVLLSLVKFLSNEQHGTLCDMLILEDGVLTKEFAAYGDVFYAKNHYSRLDRVKKRLLHTELNPYKYTDSFKHRKYDLIYANTVATLPVALSMKTVLNTSLLLHVHELQLVCEHYGVSKMMLQGVDHFVAVCTKVRDMLVSCYDVNPKLIQIVHPFSDNLLSQEQMDHLSIHNRKERFIIGTSGTLDRRKGSDIFPLVVKRFIQKYPNVHVLFRWIGGYANQDYYKSLLSDIEKLGISKFVELVPHVSNSMFEYEQNDLFMLLSREDPFPLVCMENASLAKPIVLFDNATGLGDMLMHDESCLFVPYLDIDKMCDALYSVHVDESAAIRLGLSAQSKVKQKFNKEISLASMANLLTTILEK